VKASDYCVGDEVQIATAIGAWRSAVVVRVGEGRITVRYKGRDGNPREKECRSSHVRKIQ
jgi:hypothetical protein